jgi:hypothetical protein
MRGIQLFSMNNAWDIEAARVKNRRAADHSL